jgi:hypothetical protein
MDQVRGLRGMRARMGRAEAMNASGPSDDERDSLPRDEFAHGALHKRRGRGRALHEGPSRQSWRTLVTRMSTYARRVRCCNAEHTLQRRGRGRGR